MPAFPREKRPTKKDREKGDALAVELLEVGLLLCSEAQGSQLGLEDWEMGLDAGGVSRDPGDEPLLMLLLLLFRLTALVSEAFVVVTSRACSGAASGARASVSLTRTSEGEGDGVRGR